MSARMNSTHVRVVELAVLIARQPIASPMSARAVADEATRFYLAASRLIGTPPPPPAGQIDAAHRLLQAMADAWGGVVLTPRDPNGCTVGLRFPGRYTGGINNVFFVC